MIYIQLPLLLALVPDTPSSPHVSVM
jgi:hypothetical protein